MKIRRQDADFTLGGKDSAISCPVGVHLNYSVNAFKNCLEAEFLRKRCAVKY